METGNIHVAKMINTINLMFNAGENLIPEFKVYMGDVLAEEAFEASQPGKPVVRRDQDAEMDKLRRSNPWVSSYKVG